MKKKTKIQPKPLWAGMITFDMYETNVPVFIDNKSREAALRAIGVEPEALAHESYYGLCCVDDHPQGGSIFSIVLSPESNISTWAHEASHLVDFIFDYLGIHPGVESTENRAYMVGYVTSRFAEIMGEYHAKQDRAAKRRARAKPSV